MCKFTRYGQLLLTAAAALCLAGCSKTPMSESVSVTLDTLTDERDGKKYRTVAIGGQRWMAENLNYETPDDSWCYEDDSSNCKKYGRLYNYRTAKMACPAGWHLPSHEEWDDLGRAVGGKKEYHRDYTNKWEGAGKKLKATRGWTWSERYDVNGNGMDDYGFSALPGGYFKSRCNYTGCDGKFGGIGVSGEWWTASQGGVAAYTRGMDSDHDHLGADDNSRGDNFSVRCVQDDGELSGDTSLNPALPMEQSWKSGQTTVTLSSDGTLRVKPRVKGGSEMEDYKYQWGSTGWIEYNQYPGGISAPWLHDDDSLITNIIIEEGVTRIGDFTFIELYNLKSVTIPAGMLSIGKSAFDKCINLISVTIPDGVTSIGQSAFGRCEKLTSVTIPNSVTSIERSAFNESGLTSITIPNSVTYIGDAAFANCTDLTSVIIPSSVTILGSIAFAGCTGLTSVIIQGGETTIGDGAFMHCLNLTSVTLPDNETRLSSTMFAGCTSLTSVTLPKSMTQIGWRAFADCKNLTSIISRNPVPPPYVERNAFDGINLDDICLYVPAGSVRAYLTADVWKEFYDARGIDEKTDNVPWAWLTLGVLTALILSAAVFVVVKKLLKSSRKGVV